MAHSRELTRGKKVTRSKKVTRTKEQTQVEEVTKIEEATQTEDVTVAEEVTQTEDMAQTEEMVQTEEMETAKLSVTVTHSEHRGGLHRLGWDLWALGYIHGNVFCLRLVSGHLSVWPACFVSGHLLAPLLGSII